MLAVGLVLPALNLAEADTTYPLPAPVYLTGTANATITITFGTAPASGTSVSCSLSLISNDPRAPSDTQNTSETTTGGNSVVCPIALNYRWRLRHDDDRLFGSGTDAKQQRHRQYHSDASRRLRRDMAFTVNR